MSGVNREKLNYAKPPGTNLPCHIIPHIFVKEVQLRHSPRERAYCVLCYFNAKVPTMNEAPFCFKFITRVQDIPRARPKSKDTK